MSGHGHSAAEARPGAWVEWPARLLMALLFLISGTGKLAAVGPTQAYMAAYGVPGLLLWPAAAFEIVSGVLLVAGLFLRPLSLLLAFWCLLTAVIFHTAFHDPIMLMMFLKNITMAGGFVLLARWGATGWTARAWLGRQRASA